jgi:hypothetical protein
MVENELGEFCSIIGHVGMAHRSIVSTIKDIVFLVLVSYVKIFLSCSSSVEFFLLTYPEFGRS